MTNSNSTEPHGIKFQPMPKRFMVWDKLSERFCRNINNDSNVFTIIELAVYLSDRSYCGTNINNYRILQSTNLFAKDGKEIFEGSIVSNGECRAVCVWDNSNAEFDFEMVKGGDQVKSWLNEYKIIGHILSNPRLLEEK